MMRGRLNIGVPILNCLLLCIYVWEGVAAERGPIVRTKYGEVEGMFAENVKVFKGIPYAGSVSDELRWTDPVPPDEWNGIRPAIDDPPACPQKCKLTCPKKQDEDCLFLNVYTPLTATEYTRYPVMVFIHGGSFLFGQGVFYDGSYLASSSEIIVVTINYRLGALGFLVYGGDAIKGNFGIKDQALALKWVQENIQAFGGNKGDVTISGESAGAMSVAIHMTRKGGYDPPLFHKAIVESDPYGLQYRSRDDLKVHMFATIFGTHLDCLTVECLRSKSYEDVLDAQAQVILQVLGGIEMTAPVLVWAPVLDGEMLAEQPLEAFEKGEFAKVPTIMGTTTAEGIMFVYNVWKGYIPMWAAIYRGLVELMFGLENAETIFDLYGYGTPFKDNRLLLSQIVTDYLFYCPTVLASRQSSLHNPVYSYIFDQPWPIESLTQPMKDLCSDHTCHAAEIPYVFHMVEYLRTEEEKEFAGTVSKYWGSYVKTGSPNTPEATLWPSNPQVNHFVDFKMSASTLVTVDNYRKKYCEKLDNIGYGADLLTPLYTTFVSLEQPFTPPKDEL